MPDQYLLQLFVNVLKDSKLFLGSIPSVEHLCYNSRIGLPVNSNKILSQRQLICSPEFFNPEFPFMNSQLFFLIIEYLYLYQWILIHSFSRVIILNKSKEKCSTLLTLVFSFVFCLIPLGESLPRKAEVGRAISKEESGLKLLYKRVETPKLSVSTRFISG